MNKMKIVMDWLFHPFKNYQELKNYREDYEKEIVTIYKRNNDLKLINKALKVKYEKEIIKKEEHIKNLIKENMRVRCELEKKLRKKQKSINILRGKYGTAKKKIYKLEHELKESDK